MEIDDANTYSQIYSHTYSQIYLNFLEQMKISWQNIPYTDYFAIILLLVLCTISMLILLHQSEVDERIRANENYILQIEKNLKEAEEDLRKTVRELQELQALY